MANKVEVIVGTYEEYLLGYKVGHLKNGKETLSQSFATRSHTASVRCVAACGKYLASGGADDRIFLYDMLTRKEIQVLIHHEGTVNALAFTPDATHILSGGDDGKIAAVRTNTWQVEVIWKKAHSGSPVTNISCHPSGKLALSLGNDLTLRTWNLIKGRLAYTTNLKSMNSLGKMADGIAWSPCGDYFTLLGARVVQLLGIKTASILKEQSCEARPTSVCWLTKSKFVVGLENGKLMLLTVQGKEDPVLFTAHKQRVKAIAYTNEILATASSSGDVTLWIINIKEKTLDQICSSNIGCRPTCIALIDLAQFDDDYVLKREDESVEELVDKSTNDSNKPLETGSVVIEFDDDDRPIAEVLKSIRDVKGLDKVSKKDKSITPKSQKDQKDSGKETKNKESQWEETPVKQKMRKKSVTSDDDSKWDKKYVKDNASNVKQQKQLETSEVDNKSKKNENKSKDKIISSEVVKTRKEIQNAEENSISQATEAKIKNECKKVSVEIKRTKKTRGRNQVNYVQKTESKQTDKADSDDSSSLDDFEMPSLKREHSNFDRYATTTKEDSSQGSPNKKKKKLDVPKKRPASARGRKGSKF